MTAKRVTSQTVRTPASPRRTPDAALVAWFASRGWKPAPFQREAWKRWLAGESCLLHTPTAALREAALSGDAELARAADKLWGRESGMGNGK